MRRRGANSLMIGQRCQVYPPKTRTRNLQVPDCEEARHGRSSRKQGRADNRWRLGNRTSHSAVVRARGHEGDGADYDPEGGEHTVKTIKETGGAAVFHAADVSNPQHVDGLMHKVVETYGRLDCAFSNAGIEGQRRETPECSLDNWNRVIAINLTGVFLCMKYEIPLMLKHGGGSIVNTASASGWPGGRRTLRPSTGWPG